MLSQRLLQSILQKIEYIPRLAAGYAIKNPKKVIGLFIALAIFLSSQLFYVTFSLNVDEFADATFPSFENYRKLKRWFKLDNASLVIFSPQKNNYFTQEDLCRIDEAINNQLRSNDELVRVRSPFSLRRVKETDDNRLLFPKVLPSPCEQLSAIRQPNQSEQPLKAAPQKHVSLLSPVNDTPFHGVLTDPEGRDVFTQFVFRDTPGGSPFGRFHPMPVRHLIDDLQEAFNGSGIRVQVIGTATYLMYLLESFLRDQMLNLVVLVVFFVLFRLFYGTWRGGILLLINLGLLAILLFGSMSLFRVNIEILTNQLFVIVAAAVIQDFLFISQYQMKNKSTGKSSIKAFITSSFMTSITTVIGFGSLCISDLEPIQRFGFWAAFGAMAEWAITFMFIPAFIQLFPRFQTWTAHDKSLRPALFDRFAGIRFSPLLARGMLIIAPLGLLGLGNLNLNESMASHLPDDNPINQGIDYLTETRGWYSPIYLAFYDIDDEEKNRAIVKAFTEHPNIKRVVSPYDIYDFLTKGLSKPKQELIKAEITDSGLFEDFFTTDYKAMAILYLDSFDTDVINSIREMESKHCGGRQCLVAGPPVSYADYASKVVPTLVNSFILSLVMVSLFLLFLTKALKTGHGHIVILSSLWGNFIMIGLLSLMQFQINAITCTAVSILVGIAGDNGIQYLYASKNKSILEGIKERGVGSIQITIIMIASMAIFTSSMMIHVAILTLLLCIGFFISLIGDLWILKEMLRKIESKVGD